MENLFLNLLNISITAGYLVIAVLLLRPLLKKAPKYVRCILWGLVGVRLLFPFSVESVLSLIPSAQTVPQEILYSPQPQIHSGIPVINSMVNPVLSQSMAPTQTYSANPMQVVVAVAWNVWLLGMVAMALYAIISYLRLRHKLREAAPDSENIWQCDGIGSAFLLGIVKPRIYLPSDLCGESKEFVIAHEKAHLHRKDHWWKPLGYLLLTVYWFNPLMWVAYIFLCRDIEYACDEKVIKQLGVDCKKAYSEALIGCSIPRKMISACPVAFGEDSVKGRVKSILNYKKPAFWIILIALAVCIAVAVCFLTVPPEKEEQNQEAVSFVATVTSLNEDCIFVEPVKAAYERSVVDRFMISFTDTTRIAVFVGDTVFITYDGKIDKTDPPKLPNVKHIRRIYASDSNYIQKVVYDIDRDGVAEECMLNPGPTSGVLSVDIIAKQNGVVEYYGLFGGPEWNDIYFRKKSDGTVVLVAQNWINPYTMEEVIFDLSVEGDRIIFIEKSSETMHIPKEWPEVGPDNFRSHTEADVDKDGITEDCYLTWQPEPACCNLFVSVYENGTQEYFAVFFMDQQSFRFDTLDGGEPVIFGSVDEDHTEEQMRYLTVVNGQLTLEKRPIEAAGSEWYTDPSRAFSSAYFDIDGDGVTEDCYLNYGPTSGVFTFVVTAYENNVLEYATIYTTQHATLAFNTLENGKTVIEAIPNTAPEEKLVFEISVSDGVIVLKGDGAPVQLWGSEDFTIPTTSYLRKNYPQFFGLSTSKGLEVYVWYNGTWRCGVRSATNRDATREELMAFRGGAELTEMAMILQSYGIPATDVAIRYDYNPAFSGPYDVFPGQAEQDQIKAILTEGLDPVTLPLNLTGTTVNSNQQYPLLIYAYQMAENAWYFQFVEDAKPAASVLDIMNLPPLNAADAKKKLAGYDIPEEDIVVIVYHNLYSSYIYTNDEATRASVLDALGLD